LSTSPGSAQDPVNPEAAQNLICNRGSSCGFGYINGRKYETLSDGKTSVVIVEDVFGKYFRADVFVLNLGTRPVDVLPSNFVLTELAPKSKVLKFVDGDKLVRSEERRLAWGNALTSMGGNMARQQTTTNTYSSGTVRANGSDGSSATGSYTGTATTTTSSPDYAAQARAAQTIKMRNEAFASFANATGRTMLRANTAPTNQSVQGFVLFERDKKAKSIMLSCIVGNTVYQFPFDLTVR
jgi:hypothetical protein